MIAGIALLVGGPANAVSTIDGPIDLGTAADYGVLAHDTVTNTGPTVIGDGLTTADVGLYPGTSITGFSPGNGVVTPPGVQHAADAEALQAQNDLTTAYNVAAGLDPTTSGLGDLVGQSLVPGVYSGSLSLTGSLELKGSATSVWVFQASSTLLVGSSADITFSGGASACNVFWQVGSSATFDVGAHFAGTVMANDAITADTSATFTGRLLSRTKAVTLDTNTIIVPPTCAPGSAATSPTITSDTLPEGSVGTPYDYTVTSEGSPNPTYTVASGGLPRHMSLASTGEITGTPTTPGSYPLTIQADNGTGPPSTASYTFVVLRTLALTGTDSTPTLVTGGGLLGLGLVATAVAAIGRRRLSLSKPRRH